MALRFFGSGPSKGWYIERDSSNGKEYYVAPLKWTKNFAGKHIFPYKEVANIIAEGFSDSRVISTEVESESDWD